MANPRTPTELKRKRGFPGHDGHLHKGEVIALARVGGPGGHSTAKANLGPMSPPEDGATLVQQMLDAGAGAWVGSTDAVMLLPLLAEAWDERRQRREQLMRKGRYWPLAKQKSETAALRDLEKQITQWLSLLGLTPIDRSKLGVAEVKAQSTLEALQARRAAGRQGG